MNARSRGTRTTSPWCGGCQRPARFNPYGAGSLQLNGAVNRANANDTAQGKYQFVASDFGRLTYRANGAETLTVQAFDGQLWSDPTLVAVDGGGYVSGSGALFGSDRRIGT